MQVEKKKETRLKTRGNWQNLDLAYNPPLRAGIIPGFAVCRTIGSDCTVGLLNLERALCRYIT